jgi:hypothetical protein
LVPGAYSVDWDGTDENCRSVPAGIYYGVLEKGGAQAEIKKLIHHKR